MPADPGPDAGLRALSPPDTGAPTTLLLVRHGATDLTGSRLLGGDDDGPPLSARGADAVHAAAGALPPFDAVVAAPSRRARETAALLAGQHPVEEDAGWAELRMGDWHRRPPAEVAAAEPEAYAAWRAGGAPPGGESVAQLAERVAAARDRLVAAHPGRSVLVVTHTGPVRAVVAAALEAGPAAYWRLRVDPAALTTVKVWSDGGVEVASVNVART